MRAAEHVTALRARRWSDRLAGPFRVAGRVAVFGVLAVVGGGLVAGCARVEAPPGGPPDRLPPLVISTEPDTFATEVKGLRTVRFRFSERISERPSAGSLDQAVRVSPVTGEVRVEHGQQSLKVSLDGGFQPGRVYRVTVRPVIRDLFDNVLSDPFELVFSTGGRFHPNLLAGRVVDRITGEPLPDVRVWADPREDSPSHVSFGDSAGIFALRFLPPDQYRLRAFQDLNRNDSADFSEAQASRRVVLGQADTVIMEEISLLRPDTTPPVLASVEVRDSMALQLGFDDYLDPELPLVGIQVELYRGEAFDTLPPDSLPGHREPGPAVEGVYHPWAADSVLQARADSIAREEGEEVPPREEEDEEEEAKRLPGQTARVLLAAPLLPGAVYEVEVSRVSNIYGTPGGGGRATFAVPEREEPQDTAVADSMQRQAPEAPPDTTETPPDTPRLGLPAGLRLYRRSPISPGGP